MKQYGRINWRSILNGNEIREERRNKRKAIEEAKSKEKRMKSNENNKSQDDVKAKIKSMMGKGETMGKKTEKQSLQGLWKGRQLDEH